MKSGKLMTVNEIIQDIKKYRSYMKFSGGGVTITGGDPFVQFSFLEALLAACKAEGFHTAIDTSGYATPQTVERILTHTDLMLLDIKSINPVTYEAVTGVPLDKTLETLRIARLLDVEVWIRFVLVPGLTDSTRDMQRLANFLDAYKNVKKVEVIPFNKVGEYKWKDLGREYELWDTPPPSPGMMDIAKRILAR